MSIYGVAAREVGVLIALVQPRIVISRHATRCHSARLHAFLQRLELAEKLSASVNVKPFVDANYFHCTIKT